MSDQKASTDTNEEKDQQIVAKSVAWNFTQPFDQNHDNTIMGIRPKNLAPPPPIPAHVKSQKDLLVWTLKQLPLHFMWQTVYEILPALSALLLTFVWTKYYHVLPTQVDIPAAPMWHWRVLSYTIPKYSWGMGFISTISTPVIMWGQICFSHISLLFLFAPWVSTKFGWAGTLSCSVFLIDWLARGFFFHFAFDGHEQGTGMAIWYILMLGMCQQIYASIHGRCCHPVFKEINVLGYGVASQISHSILGFQFLFYTLIFFAVIRQGDGVKAVFVLLINPIVTETLAILARFACRCLKHNHPTTSFILIAVNVAVKKMYARFIIYAIKSAPILIIISIFSALLEFFLRYTMPMRDRACYRLIFKKLLPIDRNPCALMSDARNRSLRAETENLEALTDLVYILVMLVLPLPGFLHAGTCKEGTCKETTFEMVWGTQALQYVIENSIDIVIIFAMSIGQNYHVAQQSKIKCPYWTFMVSITVCYILNGFFDFPFFSAICHSKVWKWEFWGAFCVDPEVNSYGI
jgi:hypothetical protein